MGSFIVAAQCDRQWWSITIQLLARMCVVAVYHFLSACARLYWLEWWSDQGYDPLPLSSGASAAAAEGGK
jgi:hypothetical protein